MGGVGLPSPAGLDTVAGNRVVSAVNALQHAKGFGAGQLFRLRDWQIAILRELFGRVRLDGTRQYRTCYIEIPRKNGKTELAAAIALYLLVGDKEIGAEVYTAAADREQATLVFAAAAHMVDTQPDLRELCHVVTSQKRIVHHRSRSVMRAISAEAYSKHGFNASAVIYDELHAAPNRELYDVLSTSMAARPQPLFIVITTAGWDRTSICWELHDYACRVRDGVVDDPTFLPVIYGAPDDADWTDEAVWRACNPALGDFRSLDEMRMQAERAKAVPALQNTFRRLYLNQWTEQHDRWIDMSRWRAEPCLAPVDAVPLEGAPCYAGLDLGQSDDFTAFVLIWQLDDGRLVVKPRFWVPRGALTRYPHRPYAVWEKAGALKVTDGDVIDVDQVEAAVRHDCLTAGVTACGYDQRFAEHIRQHLEGDGIEMVNVLQGFKLNEALVALQELVVAGQVVHGGHPVLDWMASNAVVRHGRDGDIRVDKQKAGEKIDGIQALTTAVEVMLRVPPKSTSVYKRRGALVLG